MLFCRRCGAEVEENFRFCEKCFANLSVDGAVINNNRLASDAAERIVENGDFLPDAFIIRYDLSGCRIGAYRLSKKIFSYLESDYYSAVDIYNGRKMIVRHFSVGNAEYSDRAEILCGKQINDASEQAINICKEEYSQFKNMCMKASVPCVISDVEGFVSSDRAAAHIFVMIEEAMPFVLQKRQDQLSFRDIIKLAIDICGFLLKFERVGLIYNSIFESNIFINNSGQAVLSAEFDRALQRNFIITPSAQSFSMYIPPNCTTQENNSVYSLAVMLYRSFNGGRLPYMNYFNKAVCYPDFLRAEQKRNSFLELQLPANSENMLGNMLCAIIGNENWRDIKISDVKNTLNNSLNYLSSTELDRKIN